MQKKIGNFFPYKTLSSINIWLIFVSPNFPLRLQATSPEVWVSQNGIVEVKPLGSSLLVRGRTPGTLTLHGARLAATNKHSDESPEGLVRIVSLTDSDHQKLQRCSTEFYNFVISPPEFSGSPSDLDLLATKDCLLSELQIPASNRELFQAEIFKSFVAALKDLASLGFRILGVVPIARGRFEIQMSSNLNEELIKHRFLEETPSLKKFAPFVNFKVTKSPAPGNTLLIDLILLEVSRSEATHIGLSLPSLGESGVKSQMGSPFEKFFEFVFNSGLDFHSQQNWGRVVARPQLRVKPGKTVEFQSGGQQGFLKKGALKSDLAWKSHGMSVSLTPQENIRPGDREITLELETELSEPDPSMISSTGGVAGYRTRRLKSQFDIRTHEKCFLGALSLSRTGTNSSGLALLEQIPILGLLFQNSISGDSSSELWIGLEAKWTDLKP